MCKWPEYEMQDAAIRACGRTPIFRNLPFCEFAGATIALPAQGFADLIFSRGKIDPKKIRIARIVRAIVNVWTYAGANTFRAGRMDELKMHPTVKPVALIADAMKDCSRRGSVILDAFAGSGTTIMAAEQISRRAFCIEIDPRYVDVAIRRWQRFTGKDATLESTGQTFDEVLTARASKLSQDKNSRPLKRKLTKGDH